MNCLLELIEEFTINTINEFKNNCQNRNMRKACLIALSTIIYVVSTLMHDYLRQVVLP